MRATMTRAIVLFAAIGFTNYAFVAEPNKQRAEVRRDSRDQAAKRDQAPRRGPAPARAAPARAKYGSISLYGSGFIDGVSVVMWEGTPLAYTFISSTELLVTPPPRYAGPAAVDVYVQNPYSNSETLQYTYVEDVHFTSMSRNIGSVSGG